MKKTNLKGLFRAGVCLFLMLAVIAGSIGSALEANKNMVDGYLGTKSTQIVSDAGDDEELYTTFTADYDNTDDLVAAHLELGRRTSQEGSVLLKNNGALPLAGTTSKVTLLGLRADANTLYGATVGVSVPSEQNVTLTQALSEAGITANPVMNEIYATLQASADYKSANKLSQSFTGVLAGEEPVFDLKEPTISEIAATNADYMSSISEYADAAIVVVGRPASEAADYYPGETGVDTSTGVRNVLALSDNEKAIIDFAAENFETVIVLVNSGNAMELGDLETNEGVDAILWIGLPGNYGMRGVVDILTGAVSPSGALPDLYASDSTSTPAMANFGVYSYTNAADYLDTATDRGDYYLIEAEGIYTGYRYYETRYADVVMGQGNADSTVGTFDSTGAWNYAEEVVYPFGYGLSYTTFEQTLDDVQVDVEAKTVTATVTVTNTGSVAGKSVIELYAQAPYIPGGLEKSAVILLDYGKTETLEPGASVTVTLETDLEYLTSYDSSVESYVLDGGDYYFTVASDSHEAVNEVLAAQGYTAADGLDAEVTSDDVKVFTYSPEGGVDTTTFKTTEAGTEVSNQLADADMNTWQEGSVTYLSRSDWEGTWPETYDSMSLTEDMVTYLTNDFYEIQTSDDTSAITFNADNDVYFSMTKSSAYDDEVWTKLLDQMDLQEAVNFITLANRTVPAISSIGFAGGQYTENGPGGFNTALATYSDENSPWYVSADDANAEYQTNDTGCAPLLAATFNKDLAYAYGVLWGNDSLFNGLSFIWAPGLNLHRTQYNGRNNEYYSEDPVLAGMTGTNVILGGLTKGLVMAPKHFAFNDQESNRNGVAPFMTEQKARELELRSFQIAAEAGSLGFMTSFSRIGVKYVGAHEGLITSILKGEWGFRGYVISDMVNPATYMTWKESVVAGTTNFDAKNYDDSWASYVTETTNDLSGDATILAAIKENVHGALYAFSQSNMMNGLTKTSHQVSVNTWWRMTYKGILYGSIALGALCLLGYLMVSLKEKTEAASARSVSVGLLAACGCALVATVLAVISSGLAYALSNLWLVILLAVLGIAAVEVMSKKADANTSCSQNLVCDVLLVLFCAFIMAAFALHFAGRVNLMGYVWFSDLESGNPSAVWALNLSAISWILSIIAVILSAFFSFKKAKA